MVPFGCAADPEADADADASAYWACSCDMASVVCREKEPGWRAGDEAVDAARAAVRENCAELCPLPNCAGCGTSREMAVMVG